MRDDLEFIELEKEIWMEMFPEIAKKMLKEEEDDKEKPKKMGEEGKKLSGRNKNEVIKTSVSDDNDDKDQVEPRKSKLFDFSSWDPYIWQILGCGHYC